MLYNGIAQKKIKINAQYRRQPSNQTQIFEMINTYTFMCKTKELFLTVVARAASPPHYGAVLGVCLCGSSLYVTGSSRCRIPLVEERMCCHHTEDSLAAE